MGYWTGILGGFNQRKAETERENFLKDQAASAREGRIFEILMGSDDPEIQSLAITGMLDTANPRRKAKGIRGWVGETEASPYMSRIQELLKTPVAPTLPAKRLTPGLGEPLPAVGPGSDRMPPAPFDQLGPSSIPPPPSIPGQAAITTPPAAQASAASPLTSPVNPNPAGQPPPVPQMAASQIVPTAISPSAGAPPPLPSTQIGLGAPGGAAPTPTPGATAVPPSSAPPPPPGASAPPQPAPMWQDVGQTPGGPRQVFLRPEEQLKRNAIAKAQADVEGEYEGLLAAGFAPELARELIKQGYLRKAGYGQYALREGNVHQDAQGNWIQDLYDNLGNIVRQIPAQPPAARLGQYYEQAARELGYANGASVPIEAAPAVIARANQIYSALGASRETAVNAAKMDAPATFDVARQNNVPIGSMPSQAIGQPVATEAEQTQRRSVENVRAQLEHIQRDLLGPLPRQGELAGLAPGAAYALRRRTDTYRVPIAALEAAVNDIVNVMARSVGEQRGTQTEQDARRAESAILQLKDAVFTGDTQESATARITETLAILDNILSRIPTTQFPTPQTTPPPTPTTPTVAPPAAVNPASGPPAPSASPAPSVAPPAPSVSPAAVRPPVPGGRAGGAAAPATTPGPPGLYVGADGLLHTGSITGPVYQPGAR